ncbi:MAG: type II toxin-antitoxin system prevent-host-death family antitoxin [Waddliaceae bacterium]
MKQYGAFDAKTHFSELLNAVIRGEKCIITKHGVKVAIMIPFSSEDTSTPAQNAVRAIKKLKKDVTLGKNLTIKKLRAEGRR